MVAVVVVVLVVRRVVLEWRKRRGARAEMVELTEDEVYLRTLEERQKREILEERLESRKKAKENLYEERRKKAENIYEETKF